MISIAICSIIVVAFVCPMQVQGSYRDIEVTIYLGPCNPKNVIQTYSTILVERLFAYVDPYVVFGFSLTPEVAVERHFQETRRLYKFLGFRNFNYLARTASDSFARLTEVTLPLYFHVVGNTAASYLAERNLLNCKNVLQHADKFFELAAKRLSESDKLFFETFIAAFVLAYETILEEYGFSRKHNARNWGRIVDVFYQEYSKFANTNTNNDDEPQPRGSTSLAFSSVSQQSSNAYSTSS